MAIKPLNSVAGFSIGEYPTTVVVDGNSNVYANNLLVSSIANLGPIGNVIITGGSAGQAITTDGLGNLTFTTISSGTLSNGTSNVQVLNNGNINFSSAGNANVMVVTGTGVNVAGTLNATGNANFGNVGATFGVFTNVSGNGSTLSSITGGNVTGQVGNALVAGTVYTAAQPNITSVGTLSSLSVTGNVSGGNLLTSAAVIASTLESNVATGTAPLTVASTTKVSNLNADLLDGYDTATANTGSTVAVRDANGNISANYFIGNGSQLTGLNTSIIANGYSNVTIPAANGNVVINANAAVDYQWVFDATGNVSVPGNVLVKYANYVGFNDTDTNWRIGLNIGTFTSCTLSNTNSLKLVAGGANYPGGADGIALGGTGGSVLEANTYSLNVWMANNLTVTANVAAGGIKTDNLYYANGSPWDLQLPAGSNTQIQYNDGAGNFGASSALTFDYVGNILTVTGNANVGNIGATNANLTALTATGNANVGNIGATNANVTAITATGNANVGNLGTTGLITASGNITGGNLSGTLITGTLTTSSQPNITSVGTLSSLSVTGNIDGGNISTTGIFSASGNITGGNLLTPNAVIASTLTSNVATGTAPLTVTSTTRVSNLNVSYANVSDYGVVTAQSSGTYYPTFVNGSSTGNYALAANSAYSANLANGFFGATLLGGTLTTAAQPNITSVGTLSALTVTGNISSNNLSTTNTVIAGNGLQVTTGALSVLAGNLDVTGNINVTGNLNYSNVTDLVVGDPLIYIGANNTGDTYDLGIVGSYNDGTYYHTGIARNAADNYWTFFDGVVAEPTTVIDWANATYPTVKMGSLVATANANIAGYANVVGNANVGNLGTSGLIVATGNVTGGNLVTTGLANVGTLSVTANANVGNIGGGTAIFTTANLTTINSGLLQNGTSNVAITNNGNVNIAAGGSTTLVVTSSGANVTGTFNATGNANVGNLGVSQVLASANVTAPQLISNVATGTAPFVVTSTTQVANLNVATAGVANTVADAAQPNITSVGTLTSLSVTGNISGGNISTTGVISVTGNANVGNLGTTGLITASGNVTGGNLITTGSANVATANVSANIFLGNSTVTTAVTWASTTTTSITANQTIASFPVSGVTGVEFLVKGVDSTGSKYSVATVQAVTDGATVDYSTFGGVTLGGFTGTLAVNISGSTIRLQVTPASTNSTVWTTQYRLV